MCVEQEIVKHLLYFHCSSLQVQQQIPVLNPLLCSWTNYTSQNVLRISEVLFGQPLFKMQRPAELDEILTKCIFLSSQQGSHALLGH